MTYFLNIVLLLLSTSYVCAQNEYIAVSAGVQDIYVGDNFSLNAVTPVSAAIKIQLPTGFKKGSNAQTGIRQTLNYTTGKVEEMYFSSMDGYFSHEGTYKFVASVATKKNKVISDIYTIRVHQKLNKNDAAAFITQPYSGVLTANKEKVFVGESVFISGKIFSKNEIIVKDYQHFVVSGNYEHFKINSVHQPSNLKEIVGGEEYKTLNFDQQIVFFNQPGKINIDPFVLSLLMEENGDFKTKSIRSNPLTIEVLPLPHNPYKDFSNGIGTFSIQQKSAAKQLRQGEIFDVEINVSGKGNIHEMKELVFNCPDGFRFYGSPEINRSFENGMGGSEGIINYHFYLQAMESGKLKIPACELVFFDPVLKKYQKIHTDPLTLEVLADKNFVQQQSITEEKMMDYSENQEKEDQSKVKNGITEKVILIAGIGSPVLLLLYLFVFIKNKKKEHELPLNVLIDSTKQVQRKAKIIALIDSAKVLSSSADYDQAFKELELALKLALANRFNCEDDCVSKYQLSVSLMASEIDPSTKDEIMHCFALLEEGRYLVVQEQKHFDRTVQKVVDLLATLANEVN